MLKYLCIDLILEASMEGSDRRESLLVMASFFSMVIRQPDVGLGWGIRRGLVLMVAFTSRANLNVLSCKYFLS
jgi:hypothetical protein